MRFLATLLAVLSISAAAQAQAASYTIVGSGCTTGRLTTHIGPVPLAVQGLPRLGTSFAVQTEGSANYLWGNRRRVYLMTGLSNTAIGGLLLPFDISTLSPGRPVCGMLRTSAEFIVPVPRVNDYRTPVLVTFQVPNVVALAGLQLFQQVVSIEHSSFGPPFGSTALSAGGQATVGF